METAGNKHMSHESEQCWSARLRLASGSGAKLGSNGGGVPHLGQPVWHCKVLALLCMTSAKLCTRSSCLNILNYPRETISRRCYKASGRGGVSPSVLGRSTGAVQHGSEWCQSRIKCDLAVQTAVALKKNQIRIRFSTTFKVAWFWFENIRFNATCAVHTAKSKSDMGHIWAKKKNRIQVTCNCSVTVAKGIK